MSTLELLVRVFMTCGTIGWLVGSLNYQENVLTLCSIFVLVGAGVISFSFNPLGTQDVGGKQDYPALSPKQLMTISGIFLFVMLLLVWDGPPSAILPLVWLVVEGTILALLGAANRLRSRFGKLVTFLILLSLLALGLLLGLDVASFYKTEMLDV